MVIGAETLIGADDIPDPKREYMPWEGMKPLAAGMIVSELFATTRLDPGGLCLFSKATAFPRLEKPVPGLPNALEKTHPLAV